MKFTQVRLTKAQSRTIAIGILAVFFITVISLIKSTRLPEVPPSSLSSRQNPSETSPTSTEQHSVFSLKDFNRSEIRNGKKVWEVKADIGEYLPGSSGVKLTNSILWLYRKNGETVQLKSNQAIISLNGTSLTNAEVLGSVRLVYNDKVTMETERAIYDHDKNMVNAPGAVKITGELFDVTGEELSVNVETKFLVLGRKVKTVLKPKATHEQN